MRYEDFAHAFSKHIPGETLLYFIEFLPFIEPPFADAFHPKRHVVRKAFDLALFTQLLPFLERFLGTDQLGRDIALLVFASAMTLVQLPLSEEMYGRLASLACTPALVPFVLHVANMLGEPEQITANGLFHALPAFHLAHLPNGLWIGSGARNRAMARPEMTSTRSRLSRSC
jgi:hypothetical protein